MTNDNASLFVRVWRALAAFEEAIDPSVDNYVTGRLTGLENELRSLKTEVDRRRSA